MADERYQWLDQETAERLLRGEPVDADDDRACSGAKRLAEALDAARPPAAPPAARADLPGEAAALAAFRAAHAERAASAAGPAGTAGRTERAELGGVRLAPVPVRRPRWGRSLRYGIAAAVTAVTVGGVAVAAGTGVLPMVGPAPASSVTAGENADPLVSEDPGIRTDPATPTTEPETPDRTPDAPPTPGTETPPPNGEATGDPGTDTRDPGTPKPGRSSAGTGTDRGGPDRDPDATNSGGTLNGGTGGDPNGTGSRDKIIKACRDFRSGKLDASGRKGLAGILRNGDTLRRYCDRLLGTGTNGPDGGGSGGSGGSRDDSKDHSKDDDSKDESKGGGNGDGRHGGRGDGGWGGRGTHRSAGLDVAGLTASLPPGIGVDAGLPLPV
ncbi:hypothetical protein EAO70_29515 [Streptomyces sp. adm13(2018)]|uniref:hypothetical protein n=1 Tax=Streptomyces sp. adm13(2018) TaxID=2479007 RepID=UPI0011CE95AC|nr:hypothetical protein [Streptomyces sp. adm13(2018)]TXS11114.1 hypothetical protein EAO70_29515 [Streptomyces sp. adm13(2018)]